MNELKLILMAVAIIVIPRTAVASDCNAFELGGFKLGQTADIECSRIENGECVLRYSKIKKNGFTYFVSATPTSKKIYQITANRKITNKDDFDYYISLGKEKYGADFKEAKFTIGNKIAGMVLGPNSSYDVVKSYSVGWGECRKDYDSTSDTYGNTKVERSGHKITCNGGLEMYFNDDADSTMYIENVCPSLKKIHKRESKAARKKGTRSSTF